MAWTLVTGGAKRLGAEMSLALARQGYDVIIHYNQSKEEALDIVSQCRHYNVQAEAIQGDFSTADSLKDFIARYTKQFPQTKNLINNVGNYIVKSIMQTSLDDWQALIQSNLTTPFVLIQALVPSIKSLTGSIVNIGTSGIKLESGNTHATAYQLTKTGLLVLTRAFAKELASDKIRINMVSPGYLENSIELPSLHKIPMQRAGRCEEIARMVLFLLHSDSEYITGQNIEVAGGIGL